MKNVFLLLIAACMGMVASAQRVYFIYLQTEDQSPFYVRMGDKIISSAAAGYVILPQLPDSTYTLRVGFAKSTAPEASFAVAVNEADRGFIIKKFDEGLALFDTQSLDLVKAAALPQDNTIYQTKTDNFSSMLSKAAGDPSLVKRPVKKEEPPVENLPKKEEAVAKQEEVKPVEKPAAAVTGIASAENRAANREAATANPEKNQPAVSSANTEKEKAAPQEAPGSGVIQNTVYKPSVVVRRSESSTTEGFGLVFLDKTATHTDTIRILIPSPKVKLVTEAESGQHNDAMLTKEKVEAVVEAKQKENSGAVPQKEGARAADINTACNRTASEKDFIKLRKKMVAKGSDEAMIDEAKKEFRNRCFTVEQIKYLGSLFLTSAGRYQFFDAAYLFVSDRQNFASLEAELSDEYYIKRFKALIGE